MAYTLSTLSSILEKNFKLLQWHSRVYLNTCAKKRNWWESLPKMVLLNCGGKFGKRQNLRPIRGTPSWFEEPRHMFQPNLLMVPLLRQVKREVRSVSIQSMFHLDPPGTVFTVSLCVNKLLRTLITKCNCCIINKFSLCVACEGWCA